MQSCLLQRTLEVSGIFVSAIARGVYMSCDANIVVTFFVWVEEYRGAPQKFYQVKGEHPKGRWGPEHHQLLLLPAFVFVLLRTPTVPVL